MPSKKKEGVAVADLLQEFQKDYGQAVGSFGGALVDTERLPTGLFPLDLALAGGFPRGKISIIFGPESSSKTNLGLLVIANNQRSRPDEINVFIDIENSFNPDWAKALGVDTEKLLVIKPDYAEQAVDLVESLLYAEDIGVIVLDSIAALTTTSETESSADKAIVGGNSVVVGKLIRKATLGLMKASKEGRSPSLIVINQIRYKIGVMFGDPETQPGGKALVFASALTLRVYGKNVSDPKISSTMPIKKEVKFVVKKWKVPIFSATGEVSMVTLPHKLLKPGQSDDFHTVAEYLKSYGQFGKAAKGTGYTILGEHYPTQMEFKSRLYGDPEFGDDIRQGLIAKLLMDAQLLEEDNG